MPRCGLCPYGAIPQAAVHTWCCGPALPSGFSSVDSPRLAPALPTVPEEKGTPNPSPRGEPAAQEPDGQEQPPPPHAAPEPSFGSALHQAVLTEQRIRRQRPCKDSGQHALHLAMLSTPCPSHLLFRIAIDWLPQLSTSCGECRCHKKMAKGAAHLVLGLSAH